MIVNLIQFFLTLIAVLGLGFIIVVAISQLRFNSRPNRIGFLPSIIPGLDGILKPVFTTFKIDVKDFILYEPGCGLATTSHNLHKNLGFKKVIGVEGEYWTFQGARLLNLVFNRKIEIIQSDVIEYEMADKAIIIAYLGNSILTRMYEQGKLKNHFVVSITFAIDDLEPTQVIKINGFYKQIFIYDFRGNSFRSSASKNHAN